MYDPENPNIDIPGLGIQEHGVVTYNQDVTLEELKQTFYTALKSASSRGKPVRASELLDYITTHTYPHGTVTVTITKDFVQLVMGNHPDVKTSNTVTNPRPRHRNAGNTN